MAIVLFLGACDTGTSQNKQVPIDVLFDGSITVTTNPNGITPLAAEAVFRTKVPTRVTITVPGKEPLIHQFEEVTKDHRIPILGLYPDTENRVEIRVSYVKNQRQTEYAVETLYITTNPLPEYFPSIDIVMADRNRMEDGWTLSDLSIGDAGVFRTYPIMFDSNGDIRWYMDLTFVDGMGWFVKRLANGNLLFIYGGEATGSIAYEFDMLGEEFNRWDIQGYHYHHDVVEKPDGNLLVAVDKEGIETVEDFIIEVDRTSGAVVNEWDMRQVLDVHRRDFSNDNVDWFHMNAIWYSEADDCLIISGRNQGVVKVTRDNELIWILAPHKGWGKAGPNADLHDTSDFLLTAVDANGAPFSEAVQQGTEDTDDFSWVWGQHAPMLLPNGNLLIFDNGFFRNFGNSPNFSRGVEYSVDELAMTVQQIWQYGKERGTDFFSPIISDVDHLHRTGNVLVMPGIVRPPDSSPSYALVTEVRYPDKQVVFEARIQFKNLLSTSPILAWGQMDLVYRSERLPLYPR